MWIQILELNDEGTYAPVGVSLVKGVTAGPVSQVCRPPMRAAYPAQEVVRGAAV